MLRAAIVPQGNRIFLPLEAAMKLRSSGLLKQHVEQGSAFRRSHADNPPGKPTINEQRLPSGHRMSPHHRVDSLRSLPLRVMVTIKSLIAHMMQRLQSVQLFLHH